MDRRLDDESDDEFDGEFDSDSDDKYDDDARDDGAHEGEPRREVNYETATSQRERNKPSRTVLFLTLAPIVALTIAANVGNRISLATIDTQPLLLLILNPTNLIMAAASPQLAAAVFFTVVIIRRILVDPLYFLLGRWYGDAAIRWLERRSPDLGQIAVKLEEWFPKYGRYIIVFYPHPLAIVLAGASNMKLWAFLVYDFIGTLGIAIAIRWFGYLAEKQITGVTGFLGDHQKTFTIISIVLLIFYALSFRKQSPKDSIADAESALDEGATKPPPRRDDFD